MPSHRTRTTIRYLSSLLVMLAVAACSRDRPENGADPTAPAVTFTALAPVSPKPALTATPVPPTPPASPATGTATPTPAAPTRSLSPSPVPQTTTPPAETPIPPATEPRGFPLDPERHTGLVTGAGSSRRIVWDAGPPAALFSREDQPAADRERANQAGWNCRTHQEYEARPAVDWYIPTGTPIRATMDGVATLYAITVTNAFDHYSVDRRPYLGNPERERAPLSPFPGPGGGKGVFVQVTGGGFVTEYAHLEIGPTVARLPASAFLPGFGPEVDYAARFAPLRGFQDTTAIANWPVRRGDLIGFSGDSGYSEAPHLHYTVSRAGRPLLCPTEEAGFSDGGWLFK